MNGTWGWRGSSQLCGTEEVTSETWLSRAEVFTPKLFRLDRKEEDRSTVLDLGEASIEKERPQNESEECVRAELAQRTQNR